MKIAYGTYPMPNWPLEDSLPFIAGVGYRGAEIMISPKHVGTLPEQIDAARRIRLREILQRFDLTVTALHVLARSAFQADDALHRENIEFMRSTVGLGRDLGVREPVVIALGGGGKTDTWDTNRELMAERLWNYARLAGEEQAIIAVEAHHGALLDRSERILWMFEQVKHPHLKLHFDIVHTFMANEIIEESVKTLLPYTGHTHWTDARRKADGGWQLVLPGWGDLNTTRYVRAMYDEGWTDFITVELSGAVWGKPDFEPISAARHCHQVLVSAFQLAGVPLD
jgi:sugar phosphate isomerase/epimerase